MKNLLLSISLLVALCSYGADIESPFNDEKLVKDSLPIKFIVGGHFHGASNNVSGFPASTLLGNIDKINARNADFLISLGDLFLYPERDLKNYPEVLFSRLNLPIYNAIGNHDIEDFDYESNFGKTYFSFAIGSIGFVILDTEENTGDIKGKQLEMLRHVLNEGHAAVFVFAHRPVWTEASDKYEDLFIGNTDDGSNFSEDVLPLLKKSSSIVYMFGGSLGGEAPFSYFMDQYDNNIYFLATAIRNLPRDGMLEVTIDKDGLAEINPFSLTGQETFGIHYYNLERWSKTSGKKAFNWRLVPLYMWQMISHRYFWYGIAWFCFGLMCLYLIKRFVLKR